MKSLLNQIEITSIVKMLTGSGHWKVRVNYLKNGEPKSQNQTITDSQAIDAWDDVTDNYPNTGKRYIIDHYFRFDNCEITYSC